LKNSQHNFYITKMIAIKSTQAVLEQKYLVLLNKQILKIMIIGQIYTA